MNMREALERIAKYPMSRSEEMSIETAREIARAALASQAQQTCTACKGSGYGQPSTDSFLCPTCNGTGCEPAPEGK